ncbi:MAG: Gfo/Idh/MocA family oxidoreductase [Clostridia bacterium]|nr:Gfo/Idh/MocA family oxidoreductase [Clostridia bacterium]
MIQVAIIGFGGIAKTAHLPVYQALEKEGKVKLVAVCDVNPDRFTENMEINIGGGEEGLSEDVARYTDWREMVEKENFDMVDLCVPTFLHADLAVEMLERGYHVLSEKPMSLTYDDCLVMCRTADEVDRRLMVGQCLRFGNEYRYLKEVIEHRTFGKVLSGTFRRMSGPPVWGWDNWFMDESRSGGCVLDMHIHDVDMSRYLFGEPVAVSCVTQEVYGTRDIAHSRLFYDGFSMLIVGDWSQEGLPFTCDYRVAFEKATVDFANGKITVYPRGGEAYTPEWEANNFYEAEIKYFVDMLENGNENTANPPESAAESVRLIRALCASADAGGQTMPYDK